MPDRLTKSRNANSYFFVDNTCERRVLDGGRLHNYFRENNFYRTNDIEKTNYVVFLACGMLDEDTQKKIEKLSDIIKRLTFKSYRSSTIQKVVGGKFGRIT